jgi:signal transduction histidine kinase
MKLGHRITLYSTVSLLVLLLAVNTSIYYMFHHYTLNAELERVLSQSRTAAEALQTYGNDQETAAAYMGASIPENGLIRIIRENEEVPVSVTKEFALNNIETRFTRQETTAHFEFGGVLFASAKTPVIWADGSVVSLEFIAPLAAFEETLGILRLILGIASIVILVPSFFAARALSRFILAPIKALVATMNEIREEGTFKKITIDEKSKDELAEMGRTFNHMIELLKKNFDKQRQFVSDASHELKTPLTVISSYSRLLKRWGSERPEVVAEAADAIDTESQRMKEMTNQMLALASGENEETLHFSRIELCEAAADTARKIEAVYNRPVNVQCSEDNTATLADEGKIKQLLFILFENGMKYSDKELDVSVTASDKTLTIKVKDYGIGIPEEELPHIFERFFRVDKARNRKTGGTGLGLSIAKAIVEAHKGSITVTSIEGHGSAFTVELPRKEVNER